VAPTYERPDSFKRDYRSLDPSKRELAKERIRQFKDDLTAIEEGTATEFRSGLRVKPMRYKPGIWEMSWNGDGRATFEYGESIIEGKRHVIWRRIGTHEIFSAP
jgi:hypothetical protein